MNGVIAILLVLLILLQHRLWVGDGSLAEVRQLREAIAAQKQENKTLKERNERLQAEVIDLKEGLDAIEARARRELGMIRHDEIFYQFVDD